MTIDVRHGDCRDVLKEFPDNYFDSCVTDPPAGISFMGKGWDSDRGGRDRWISWFSERMSEVYRTLKPGAHALVWALPRTSHWTACALEDSGFEIRDCILHVFGSGFPKSLDISKAIDKAAGAERDVSGLHPYASRKPNGTWTGEIYGDEPGHQQGPSLTAPATEDAARWNGWGTSLKPAQEIWWLCRKPLTGTVAANVLEWGTGGLNIDQCRVGSDVMLESRMSQSAGGVLNMNGRDIEHGNWQQAPNDNPAAHTGRFPPNLLLTHHPECIGSCVPGCPVLQMDSQSGTQKDGTAVNRNRSGVMPRGIFGKMNVPPPVDTGYGGEGGASRFFPCFRYQAKAPKRERPVVDGISHATVKPVELMRWLTRLVTVPQGMVLDPFAGSGTTAEACRLEGFSCTLIEREADYIKLINKRLSREPSLFDDWEVCEE